MLLIVITVKDLTQIIKMYMLIFLTILIFFVNIFISQVLSLKFLNLLSCYSLLTTDPLKSAGERETNGKW